jgi:uncharacterized protein
MIIDVHAHPDLDDQPLATAERRIRQAESVGITRQLLLGDVLRFGFEPEPEEVTRINDLTLDLVARWPDHLSGLCFLNPAHAPAFLEGEIQRCLEHPGFHGVKLEVDVNARSHRLDPIMAQLEARQAFLLHHAWYKTVGKAHDESTPADIADLAGRWPGVRIVMAHLTAAGHRGIQDIKAHGNVLVDTSGSQPQAEIVEYGVRELGAQRLLFGSDAPVRDYAVQLGRINAAALTDQQRRLILHTNAAQLLGLPC